MHLALIGMSGIGKSAWATRLAQHGYAQIDADALLAARIAGRLGVPLADVYALGAWMGFPHQDGYAAREALFLAEECALLETIANELAQCDARQPTVIDLGGSAIYAGTAYFARLRRVARIVYLAADAQLLPDLVATYLAAPKPVVWNGSFVQHAAEDPRVALARCYPALLAARAVAYAAVADVMLPAAFHRDPGVAAGAFVARARHA